MAAPTVCYMLDCSVMQSFLFVLQFSWCIKEKINFWLDQGQSYGFVYSHYPSTTEQLSELFKHSHLETLDDSFVLKILCSSATKSLLM